MVAAMPMVLVAGCSLERPTSHYETYSDAVAEGAIVRGWLPEWTPRSASDIIEAHDLDSNKVMIRATIQTSEPVDLPSWCERIKDLEVKEPPFNTEWWPEEATPNYLMLPPENRKNDPWMFWNCRGLQVGISSEQILIWSSR